MDKFRPEQVCVLAIAAITGATLAIMLGVPNWTFSELGAAWVQAIGSSAGIVVAVTIPLTLWRRDENRRMAESLRRRAEARAKSISLGLTILPILADTVVKLQKIEGAWILHSRFPERIFIDAHPYSIKISEFFMPPVSLASLYPRLHELDEAAMETIWAISHSVDIVALLGTIEVNRAVQGPPELITYLENDLHKKILACMKHAEQAIFKINHMRAPPETP